MNEDFLTCKADGCDVTDAVSVFDDEGYCDLHYPQHYTDCSYCGWFGIPIIDDGAPDKCDECLQREIDDINADLLHFSHTMTAKEEDNLIAAREEAIADLEYFEKRQLAIPKADRRYNNGQ